MLNLPRTDIRESDIEEKKKEEGGENQEKTEERAEKRDSRAGARLRECP